MAERRENKEVFFDGEARHIVEALRSGIPSKQVGRCFMEARPKMMREITAQLKAVGNTKKSAGMVITGKYGEGKTHLLNTLFHLAEENNMVVSYLSLSKETPMDKLHLLYAKVIANTYLPGHSQPGFVQELEKLTANSPLASEMIAYSAKHTETDKLYYLLRTYLGTEDTEERFQLQADLEGDFIGNAQLKQIYRRIYNQPVKYNIPFSKTKHCRDYFALMSHFFVQQGYQGWVILFDEGELMGRLGKKARMKAYRNMAEFLLPDSRLEAVFSVFAYSASYLEDVIEGKDEWDNLAGLYPEDQEPMRTVLNLLVKAPQLIPLSKEEVRSILARIADAHAKAYAWEPKVTVHELEAVTQSGGYLLRTKIRAAIEYLDQLYQYGEAGHTAVREINRESFNEDVVSLDSLL